MRDTIYTLQYGKMDIHYTLLMLNRKSLEVSVYPDKRIVVKAPISSTFEDIEAKIKKKARWIKRQIAYFNQFEPRTPGRKYIGGESHLYLGRLYRLKINISNQHNVQLKNGYFHVDTPSDQPDCIKPLMNGWYRHRAKIYLAKVVDDCWDDFKNNHLNKPILKIRKMNKRWGSLSKKGLLTLNLNLIQTPKECIEYVIIHEFCHLIQYNHGTSFYKLLDRKMMDWVRRKQKLEMALVGVN